MSNEHFDVIIVGSGFGGSVMAYRLAKEKFSVCLLERGKKYPPNSFPRSPFKMKNNFWDPSKNLYGMFNVWSFKHMAALISSGLGGGSLIYANVLLRKDENWFVQEDFEKGGYEYWPITRADLDPHYDAAEKMLNAQKYPFDHSPYNQTSKTRAMKLAADELRKRPDYQHELTWDLPPLAVSFRRRQVDPDNPDDPGNPPVMSEPIQESRPNIHNHTRLTCRLCGECDVGCNYGSKNTLDYNYLTEAHHEGADIRTLSEVKSFGPRDGGGYTVNYVTHRPDPRLEGQELKDRRLDEKTLTCDRLILSAGTLGTTFLLLKNRSSFPNISRKLGTRFCGNGDLLSFAVKSCVDEGGKSMPRILDGSYGPAITSYIRSRDELDGGRGRGFYIEDAGYPDFFNWMMQVGEAPNSLRLYFSFFKRWAMGLMGLQPDSDLSAEISTLFGACALSSSSLPLLGMGRDIPDGNMILRDEKYLSVDWKIQKSGAFFSRMNATMKDISTVLRAKFVDNPTFYLSRLITVHPLGGCPMGRDEREGVVNSCGEVFNYPGLYVADGSVLPGPVGANPSLTIAALSDHFADCIIEKHKGDPK